MFLSQAEVGKISAENILFALVLFSPGLINLVFPVSVFLALGFVLTPIFKNHETVLTAGSMTTGRVLSSQRYVILGIFSFSLLLSAFLSPYFNSKGEDLLDKDNSFASKILAPSGLVSLKADTFNVFGYKDNDVYRDLIFINSQSIETFIYGTTGVIKDSPSGVSLVLDDGFLFDNERNFISKFNIAEIPIDDYSSDEYTSIVTLFSDLNSDNIKEIFKRFTLPIFCVISFIFSVIFSSYSSFFGREKTYFFLAIFNILYLLSAVSSFDVTESTVEALIFNFYWMHLMVLIIAFVLTSKKVKKGFGYEGI
tara:strand:- start:16909 stop:17838 length:930 start_codon:yes stop_codon:yes gene_type:complete